jgi:DHA1 family tetracycline resistance protein-like MFS transporter
LFGFLAYSLSRDGATFYYSTFIFALMGFFQSSINGVMSTRLSALEQGRLSGASSSILGLSGIIGPKIYSTVFGWSIAPGRSTFWQGAPFALAALFMVVSLVIAFFVIPKRAVESTTGSMS